MFRFLPFVFVLMITSCVSNETSDSKNVKQSEIWQTYRINWVKGEGTVTASFRFGGENGTTLKLSNPAKVTCNGQALTEAKFLFGGTYYSADQTVYQSKHVYRFTDQDGKVYQNTFDFEAIEIVKAPRTVSKHEKLELELSRPVNAAEGIKLVAEVDTAKTNQATISTNPGSQAYYDQNTQKLVIDPAFFEGFPDRPVTLWIEKTFYKSPLEQPTNLPGELHFYYASKEIKIKRVK